MRKLKGHIGIVNAVCTSKAGVIATGSDDMTAKLWDSRARDFLSSFELEYQVTSVALTPEYLYLGGVDNSIKAINLRKNALEFSLLGHTDTVTGVSLSRDGKRLASNSMDNTVRVWDVSPFVIGERQLHTLHGIHHSFEKNLLRVAWNTAGTHVAAGSADRYVNVWDVSRETEVVQRLGGHTGTVNEVAFSPRGLLASGSSDRTIFLGELQ